LPQIRRKILQRIRLFPVFFVLIVMYLSGTANAQQWSGVLDASRATDWSQAGIQGGIPSGSWAQCGSTIAAYGSSGSYASPSTITNALNSCSGTSKYVLLGAGDFYLNSGIVISGKDHVELRGMGPKQTRLHFSSGATCNGGGATCLINFESSDTNYAGGSPTSYSWNSGYTQGSTSIQVASSASIQVGTMVVLDQCDTGYSGTSCSGRATDNGNFFSCQDAYNPSGPTGCSFNGPLGASRPHRGQQEMHQVTACSPSCNNGGATTLTFAEPLIHPNWASGQTPMAWFIQPSQYVGMRNFSIDGSNFGYSSIVAGPSFNNVANYWISNVAMTSFPNITLYIVQSMHGEIESNYIYNSGQSNASSDNSAINWFGGYNLLDNNIIQNAHLAFIANGPNAGNVVAYNYQVNGYTGNGTVFGQFWPGHASGADYNLYEGNVGTMYDTDQTHGTQLMDTLYRNLFTGWESCSNGNCGSDSQKNADSAAVMQLSFNRYGNIVANVLGTPGVSTLGYQYSNSEYFFSSTTGYPLNWGSGNQCSPPNCAGGPIPMDSGVKTTSMLWGNWDSYDNAIRWNSAEVPTSISVYPNSVPTSCTSSGSCPASFYYSAKPSWWSSSIPFPAIGPDVSGGNVGQCGGTPNASGQFALVPADNASQCAGHGLNTAWAGHVNAVPAMDCYLSTMGGPPDGTGGALAFDAASCYSNSSSNQPTPGTPINLTGTVVQ
jgi:hypothetical protein